MTKLEIIIKMGISLFVAGFGYAVLNTELLEWARVAIMVISLIVVFLVWTQRWHQKSGDEAIKGARTRVNELPRL